MKGIFTFPIDHHIGDFKHIIVTSHTIPLSSEFPKIIPDRISSDRIYKNESKESTQCPMSKLEK